MGSNSLFHKIKIGFVRHLQPSISTSEEKEYGNSAEEHFICKLLKLIPDCNCKVKRNIFIQTEEGNAEIDCLILYKNKLFAIEIKSWEGRIVENSEAFVQYKTDRWDIAHQKRHKSPFKQIDRAIFLLKKQIPERAWINSIVFFESSSSVRVNTENVWFDDINELVKYIISYGKASYGTSASLFFEKCVPADRLIGRNSVTKNCIVCDESLNFEIDSGMLTRENIRSITVSHRWSYDKLEIETIDNDYYTAKLENSFVNVINNEQTESWALSKIDKIILGER